MNHHQFFLDYLSVSPWSPKNRAGAPPQDDLGKGKGKAPHVGLQNDTGSYLIAQVLGLKFRYYQVRRLFSGRPARMPDLSRREQTAEADDIPEKLYLMTALLIWNGFVKFGDIWPHVRSSF